MKKILLLFVLIFSGMAAKAQITEQLTFSTTIGVGIAMNAPASTPFSWQVLGHYVVSPRFSAGIGTGVSLYEKALIPLFADARFMIMKPRKFTPYLECGAGYSFAPDKNANGGFYLHPSVGILYSICGEKKISFALGYELQKLERLKRMEQSHFVTEFTEKLSHASLSLKIGYMF